MSHSQPPSTADARQKVIIFTDGAAEPNPGPGGYGVVLIAGKHRKEISGGFRKTTNNRMELMAVIVALESLTRSCRVILYSDSKYVVDSVSRGSVMRWQKKNWFRAPGERAKNVDLWKRFLEVFEKHAVEFRWVKGHAGITENERCDVLAVEAAQQYDLPVDEGYVAELDLLPNASTSSHAAPAHASHATPSAPNARDAANASGDTILAEGAPCRKCHALLVKKPTKPKAPKPGQTYRYDWYLYCPNCHTMYLVDEAKRSV